MKTTRRQELRTNDLSQQIAQTGDYIKQHAVKLVALLIVVLGLAGGGYWTLHQRQVQEMDGWATLARSAVLAEIDTPIGVFESLAREARKPGLSAQAWLKVGDTAMARMWKARGPAADQLETESADNTDWPAKAEAAYKEVATRFPNDLTASGKAMVLLGVLAENQDDATKAGQWYSKITENELFAGTPFAEQATYRLANLAAWAEPVVFPDPVPTVPMSVESVDVSPMSIRPVAAPPPAVLETLKEQLKSQTPPAQAKPPAQPADGISPSEPAPADTPEQPAESQEPPPKSEPAVKPEPEQPQTSPGETGREP